MRAWQRALMGVLLSGAAGLASFAHAWGNHALLSYRALEAWPEVASAPAVPAEPLDAFLRAQGPAIAALTDAQEAWARAHIRAYTPRPEGLRWAWRPEADEAERRSAFARALRLSPQAAFALFVQVDPRHPERTADGPPLAPEAVASVAPSKGATQRFVAVAPGQPVPVLAVLASASDEPDYGYDIDLFDDNAGGGGLGFGVQPFGNPAIRISSQAPFHMGFFHQGAVFNTLAPAFARSFAQLRVHQYTTLAALAFRTGHAYWGWRFTGLALHYVQDLTQPYHASAAPGERLPGMLWANVLDKLGWPDRKAGLVVLQSNRHFVLENFQTRRLLAAAQAGEDTANERALRDVTRDGSYPAWHDQYLREVVAAEAHAAGPATDAAIVVGAPARYVLDPAFDFGAQEGQIDLDADMRRQLQAQREAMQEAVARLLAHLGAHTRNTVRGVRALADSAPRAQ
ncbi:phospholipase [Inhella crocodyli]|uniref:Phospholipase n=2 Tax=Inhella crocodyli TaxID=2499851 RepID=A0A3S2UYB2_9BURK|nr:phospholipase [Inhella crocodyli]